MIRKLTILFAAGVVLGAILTLAPPRSSAPLFIASAGAQTPPTSRPAAAPEAARVPHKPPKPDEMRPFMIKELANFDYDPDNGVIPDDVKALSGMKVRLRGYVLPTEDAGKITSFTMVPSLFSCCFGQPPGVQHIIMVQCVPGVSAEYTDGESIAEGILTVGEVREDGYLQCLFSLKCTKVHPLKN